MWNKVILPGKAHFFPLYVFQQGVDAYKRFLKNHNSHVSNKKNVAVDSVQSPDCEKVLKATSNRKTIREIFIKNGPIII